MFNNKAHYEILAEDYRRAAEWNSNQGNFQASCFYTGMYMMYVEPAPDSELDVPVSVDMEGV